MNYGYIRVSTDRQSVLNQRHEIKRFCMAMQIHIDGWIEETVSGTKDSNKRRLGRLLRKVHKGDLIICAEISRLGRNLFMIMDILYTCMKKECRVWTVKEGYRLGEDIQSKVLAFAFSLSAEIERNLISLRTKEALDRKRLEGVRLGRPAGTTRGSQLDGNRDRIIQWLSEGIPKKEIAARCAVSPRTFYYWLRNSGGEDSLKI